LTGSSHTRLTPPSEKKFSGDPSGQDYKKAELANARLNAVSEVPDRAILESADFKAIVTGELVSARQPYKPAFTFACQAGHVFLANRLPATSDQSHGFWRRFVVVKFNRRFVSGGAKDTKDEAPAKGREALIAELKAELPGIWAWALEGARRLLARGRFELPVSHHEALAEWRRNADQVQDFVDSCCKPAAEASTWSRARLLYDAYRRWATGTGHRNILTERSFATRLAENVPKRQDNRGSRYALILLHDAEWE
jgi:putative DNA primase/helicase